MEISNLTDAEFKILLIRMLNELSEGLKSIKKDQPEMMDAQLETKEALTEIKNNLHSFNNRVRKSKKQTINLEYKEAKNAQSEQQKEKRIQKNEESVKSPWDNLKHANIRILGVPEGEEREQEIENLFETIMAENFPNLVKETNIQVQEAQRVPNKMNPKRPTPRHIIIKMQKVQDKERILKAARERQLVTYKGVPIRLSANFSKETLQARREWQEIFRVMKSKTLQPGLLYPAKLSFRIDGHIKTFPDKKKLKEFITTKLLLYEMMKGLFEEKDKIYEQTKRQ
uniref:L1 transposable element RRM domain-containing protein n=1 Tax=Molossus molossus TaxID=27622 RepID=A0A7J8JWB3_MOLMO|nr:hypothetical protein HJG59_008036 [Molossus molossus]